MSGYSDAGASFTKRALREFNAQSMSAVEDIDFNNFTLRQRARMLYMASPIAASAINTNRTKIVGKGLRLKCNIDHDLLGITPEAAKEWSRRTEAEFSLWCKRGINCDALGANNFYELQALVCKSWLMSGDVFIALKHVEGTTLNPYSLRLHVIEADRICTPGSGGLMYGPTEGVTTDGHKIHDGVEVDENGKIIAFHVCKIYPGQASIDLNDWVRVTAVGEKTGTPNILQVMDPERPDQYRGVSYLSPVIEMILQTRRYTESELMAALVQTYFTVFIKTNTDGAAMPFVGDDNDDDDSEERYDKDPKLGPANVMHLLPGEEADFAEPKIPTAGFETFVKMVLKQIGAGLEMPYDVLVKEFNSSYSASKGALEEAWEAVRMRRQWLVTDFCQPVYETWLAEAVALGRIQCPGFFTDPLIRDAWCGSRWDGPAQTHLDPLKEAKANVLLVANGWKTNEQITREFYGENWEENMQKLTEENKLKNEVIPPVDLSLFTEDDDTDEEDESNGEDNA